MTVSVESSEACGGCASRSACSLGVQSNTRNILVTTTEATNYSIGERVMVATRTQMGLLAVLVTLGMAEGLAALVSLLSVAVYYGVIWLFRDKLAQKISFIIYKE